MAMAMAMAISTAGGIINQYECGPISVPNCYNAQAITKHSVSLIPPPPSPPPPSKVFGVRYCKRACRSLSVSTQGLVIRAAESMTSEKLGIKIHTNPPESKLTELGVRKWPKWGCPPSKFPWTYSLKETCYLLEGKVTVFPDGSKEGVEIGAGDLVVFPKGMSCTWDVSEAVDKHYNFD